VLHAAAVNVVGSCGRRRRTSFRRVIAVVMGMRMQRLGDRDVSDHATEAAWEVKVT
jgi:hypothetical protein